MNHGTQATGIHYDLLAEELKAYHAFTDTVAVYPGAGTGGPGELAYLSLGLPNEVGELIGIIKKYLRRGGAWNDGDGEKIRDELGDVLFYWTRLCIAAGIDPEDVVIANVAKLQGRKKSGTLKDRSSAS